MELALGTVVCGRYELVRLIGMGGSSSVYEARHLLFDHEDVGNALDALTSMNVLARPSGRPSIECKLLEGWVENHMELPNAASVQRRERRVRVAAAGVMASALLYAVGSLGFAAGEQTVEVTLGTCTTTAVLPRRAVAADGITVRIARDCAIHDGDAIELRAEGTTFARFSGDGASPRDTYRIEAPASANGRSARGRCRMQSLRDGGGRVDAQGQP